MRIARHIEAQDLTPVVADNEKAVQNTERERWDGEKVHRRNGLTMVSEERQPSLYTQFTTVRGVTKTRGFLHPDQNILKATQNSLCRAVNRRRGRCACRASNC